MSRSVVVLPRALVPAPILPGGKFAAVPGRGRCILWTQVSPQEDTMEPLDRAPAFPASVATAERVTIFLRSVYGWMCVGLAITAAVAYMISSSPALIGALVSNHLLVLGLFLAQLGLVFFLSARVDKLAPRTATLLFIAYAALAGVGQFFFMGLIGLVLASVVGMFWKNAALEFLISVVGVLVFTGLTAWDAQRLKQMATAIPEGRLGSYAILGALSLYLNFINLFLFLLRFMGGRRD